MSNKKIEELKGKAKTARIDILEMVGEAGSGHPGGSLSAIDILTVLFFHEMSYDPKNPEKPNRDRFLLSKGHASPALYSILAEVGFFPKEELKYFRKLGHLLQGHPSPEIPGVEIATGSLGQGFSAALGIALCGKLDNYDYRTYVLLGDGELHEGQVWETAMSAGVRKVDNLVAIIDYNGLAQDNTISDLKEIEPIDKKFEAFGWHTITIDGHDIEAILQVLEEAKKVKQKPVMIIAKTVKGKGVRFMENEIGWHGKAPNSEQLIQAIEEVKNG